MSQRTQSWHTNSTVSVEKVGTNGSQYIILVHGKIITSVTESALHYYHFS